MGRIACLLLLLLVAGCTIRREYDGETLDRSRLERLAAATTKAEVLTHVGPPSDMGLQLDGSVFVYRLRLEEADDLNFSFFNATFDYEVTDRRVARLLVLFDKQGRKTGYGFDRAGRVDEEDQDAREEDEPAGD